MRNASNGMADHGFISAVALKDRASMFSVLTKQFMHKSSMMSHKQHWSALLHLN
jgi:hypothetical protein